jgi:cytochrome c oxidase subunit II
MIKRIWSLCIWATAIVMVGLGTGPALAEPGIGQPAPEQIGLQGAVTPVMHEITVFHDRVNVIIIAIALFVMILMLYVIFRYNASANPKPSSFSHNTTVEVLWTVGPILILVYIGIFSFKLLFLEYEYPPPDLTIKATGNAWYWEHTYPDQGNFKVTSTILHDEDVLRAKLGDQAFDKKYGALEGIARIKALYEDAKPVWAERGLVRQLSVDNEIAVPVNKVVHVLVTSNDVIHAWTVPSFGSKLDAVPGRTAATWFKATRTGVYYGQCSVLCGRDHASMPIAVRVVDQAAFDKWVAAAKARKWDDARKILQAATTPGRQPKFAKVQSPQKQLAKQ